MIKKYFIAVLMLAAFPTVSASSNTPRYSAQKYSCDRIQSLIEEHGAAIFRYPSPRNPGLTLYDRYVQNKSFCGNQQITERVMIPSADTDRCPVKHCITPECDDIGPFCF